MTVKFDFKTLQDGFEADWPVTVNVPIDGGKTEKQEFMARFRMASAEEQEKIDALLTSPNVLEREQGTRLSVETCFVGFAASEPTQLTPALFERMWSQPYLSVPLIKAVSGFRAGAAVKN